MGLVNPDLYTTASGVQLANTYVLLGDDRVIFSVDKGPPQTFSAFSMMQIYRDESAWGANLQPVEVRAVTYPVPDPSAVYELLYGSARVAEGWGNAVLTHSNVQQVTSSGASAGASAGA